MIAGAAIEGARRAARQARLPPGVVLEPQRADFQSLLAKSLLSVSQAGYNTVVEVLRLGKPMVLVPFETATETEQRLRAERLNALGLAEVVWGGELTASTLARAIDRVARQPPERRPVLDLGGAAESARQVAALAARRAPPEPAG